MRKSQPTISDFSQTCPADKTFHADSSELFFENRLRFRKIMDDVR